MIFLSLILLIFPTAQAYGTYGYTYDGGWGERMRASYWKLYNGVFYNTYHVKLQESDQHYHNPQQIFSHSSAANIRQPHQKFTNSIEYRNCEEKEDIDYIGLISWLGFCVFVLLVGVWAGCTKVKKGRYQEQSQEQMMLAGRDISLGVGVLTMAATWVGGGFIIGAAQGVYTKGLLWTHAPVFYSLSLVVGGVLFAKQMRDAEYFTMIDPFTQKYGKWGSVLVLPAAISEIIWCAAILSSLGSTIYIILGVDDTFSIYISALLSLSYTVCGGAVSVAYTDVVQIIFVILGLGLALPFSMSHSAVNDISFYDKHNNASLTIEDTDWIGSIAYHEWGTWMDTCLLCLLGGVPWQSYFQRVLSAQSGTRSVVLSFGGSLIALLLCIPAFMFGIVAKFTDWSQTGYACHGAPDQESSKYVLPLILKYLTPPAVSYIGVGVISAAVMSSADSSLLSSSSLIARNIWSKFIRPGCGEFEVLRVLWAFTFINCGLATLLALQYKSVYELYVLCGDLTYVILFPQLVLVLYFPPSNTYGSFFSFIISFILRILCGDKYLGLPEFISFGNMTDSCPQEITGLCEGEMPFRTIIMIIGLISHLAVSWFFYFIFCLWGLDLKWDFLYCFQQDSDGDVILRNSRQLDAPIKVLESAIVKQNEYLKKLERKEALIKM